MKAPHRIGLPPQLRALYIERYPKPKEYYQGQGEARGYWRLPIHTDPTNTYGTFLKLYDNGLIERVTVRADEGDEIVVIKPKD